MITLLLKEIFGQDFNKIAASLSMNKKYQKILDKELIKIQNYTSLQFMSWFVRAF